MLDTKLKMRSSTEQLCYSIAVNVEEWPSEFEKDFIFRIEATLTSLSKLGELGSEQVCNCSIYYLYEESEC